MQIGRHVLLELAPVRTTEIVVRTHVLAQPTKRREGTASVACGGFIEFFL